MWRPTLWVRFNQSSDLLISWLLVDAEDVAGRVLEAGGDFGVVASDGLGDRASGGGDGLDGGGGVVHHDVDEEAGVGGGWAVEDPSSAYLAGGVVKGGCSVTAGADLPAEDGLIEFGGAGDVGRWDFYVTDLSVGGVRRHFVILQPSFLSRFRIDLEALSLASQFRPWRSPFPFPHPSRAGPEAWIPVFCARASQNTGISFISWLASYR